MAITERRLAQRRDIERRCTTGDQNVEEFEILLAKANKAERLLELYIDGIMRKAGLDPDAD